MTDADKKLLELAEKATPRPWLQEKHTIYTLEHHGWNKGEEIFHNRFTATVHCRANADERLATIAYIVAAANAVPKLIAENERLRKHIKAAHAICEVVACKDEPVGRAAQRWLAADDDAAKEPADD